MVVDGNKDGGPLCIHRSFVSKAGPDPRRAEALLTGLACAHTRTHMNTHMSTHAFICTKKHARHVCTHIRTPAYPRAHTHARLGRRQGRGLRVGIEATAVVSATKTVGALVCSCVAVRLDRGPNRPSSHCFFEAVRAGPRRSTPRGANACGDVRAVRASGCSKPYQC